MRMERNFGVTAPYTVGVEEELQLVDPTSLALVPAIGAVLAASHTAKLPEDSIASELSASCVEVRSPVYGTVAELAAELPVLRRRLRDLVEGCGARLAAAGAHPFSKATAQQITGKERYRRVDKEMGWPARMQAIYGLHVHVAVPDEEHAIRAVVALSRYVPLFVALSANSPFWEAEDTRLASVRTKVFGLMPRSALPPAFRAWWDARPHPRFGTVELRAPDMQTEAHRSASLAALAQCIVATADEHTPEDLAFTEENKWRATRYGLEARLHDFSTGRDASARQTARDLVKRLRHVSQDLGCEAELDGVLEIAEGESGADRQRTVFEKHGSLRAVVEH